jgi:hypothetical protein
VDIHLKQEGWVHLHTVRDPVGAYFPGAELYPAAKKKSRVTEAHVRTTLRSSFARHGLPEEVQTDWEPCLNPQPGDNFPSLFTLWLAGLGIRHVQARPGRPTDDAEGERGHRTIFDYALAGQLDQPLDFLHQYLPVALDDLNTKYPSRAHGCQGRPPVQAHPEILCPPRRFDPHQELACFDLQRVDTFLASLSFDRKVGKTGQITLGKKGRRFGIGRQNAGKVVQITFDPTNRYFVVSYQHKEIGRWKAKHLEVSDIVGFSPDTPGLIPQQLPLPLHFQEVCPIEQ